MPGRKKRDPEPTVADRPRLTVHQIVAYNFRQAREARGWTQAETGIRLERYLGYKLNQAGISAIEKTFDSDRRRNIDVAELVAFARCFHLPIGWFFVPPPGHGTDWVEPVDDTQRPLAMVAGDLIAHSIGTPMGWDSFIERIVALLDSPDAEPTRDALNLAFAGVRTTKWSKQIDLRRQALLAVTLSRLASEGEQTIAKMAELLIELVKLTPLGFDQLGRLNRDEALRLLAEGDRLVQPHLRTKELYDADFSPKGGFDDLEPIDVGHAFEPDEEEQS